MPDDFASVRATAQAMNCACFGKCSLQNALYCLYRRTLDAASCDANSNIHRIELVKPLGVVLGYQKTRIGQRDCAAFAETLAAGDAAGALAACHRMMDRAGVKHLGA